VVLPNGAEKLVDGGLKPNLDWQQLQAAGAKVAVTPQTKASSTEWMAAALGVIDLPEESTGTFELRTATANFFAITQYNHSYFYAAAITDLADALASR
jgi:membrane-bound lytic murein transglycosylase B